MFIIYCIVIFFFKCVLYHITVDISILKNMKGFKIQFLFFQTFSEQLFSAVVININEINNI